MIQITGSDKCFSNNELIDEAFVGVMKKCRRALCARILENTPGAEPPQSLNPSDAPGV